MYKITLPIKIRGNRYGIDFVNGIGETSDKELVKQLKHKRGFIVEEIDNQLVELPIEDPIDNNITNGVTKQNPKKQATKNAKKSKK